MVIISSFGGSGADVLAPSSKLVQGADGNFYGTGLGGSHLNGVVFRVTPAGLVTVLHEFDGSTGDGGQPTGLILGNDGNFYGTTSGGGTNGEGTVFKMTPDGTESVLYSFGGSPDDAAAPYSGLMQASDGGFYGVADFGGAAHKGAVWRVSPAGVETILYAFGSVANDATAGFSGLVEGSDGNFYGLSGNGGANNQGAVFKISPEGIETLVHSFSGGTDGAVFEASSLLKGADGNFYGVTSDGGANNGGTIFKLGLAGELSVLYSFSSDAGTGFHPVGALVQDSDGNIYGATENGGSRRTFAPSITDSGTLFELTTAGNVVQLSDFGPTDADGTLPFPGPILGKDGNLYGTTQLGGVNRAGVFYEFIRK